MKSNDTRSTDVIRRILLILFALLLCASCGCQKNTNQVVVYCGVDEPYASKIFAEFEQQTGIHVSPAYDSESSKSVGLSEKITAERDHPQADVFWGSEAFLSVRLAQRGLLEPYTPSNASEIPAQFKDAGGRWTGNALRARVLVVSVPPPALKITGMEDLCDRRLKGKIALSRPTAGATGAHMAALYVVWGEDKARAYLHRLHDNGAYLLGGNAVVADQVGSGNFQVGLTDSDDATHTVDNDGGKLTVVLPDQEQDGALAMPTTVCLVKGAPHSENARKLIDFLVSKHVEDELIAAKFARWSVRGGGEPIKTVKLDWNKAADVYERAQRESEAILDGREK